MSSLVDLVGKKFGKLLVLKRAGSSKYNVSLWKCVCDCGNEIVKSQHSLCLKKKSVVSCGCAYRKYPTDLTNFKIDKLLPLKIVGSDKWGYSLWLCKCDCGKEVIRSRSYLCDKKNSISSCGCAYKHRVNKRERDPNKPRKLSGRCDLMGMRFGKLIVIKHDEKTDNRFSHYWLCLCDCGNKKVILGDRLKNGNVKSCGCYAYEARLQGLLPGVAGFNRVLGSYTRSAKERGLKFDLSEEEVKKIMLEDCFYCGSKPLSRRKNQSEYSTFVYNGIDRVDNLKGYEQGNVVPCCKKCNRMKYIYDKDEFIRHCIQVDYFQKMKEGTFEFRG